VGSQSWQSILISQQVDGTAITNSTAEAIIIAPQATYTIPANLLTYAGQALRIRAMGRVSNVVTTPGTLTLRIRLGGLAGIIIANSGAMPLNIVAKTNVTLVLDWDMTVRSVGASTSATVMHSGQWQSESAVGAPSGASGAVSIPASAPAVGTGFDSTVANALTMTAQFSVLTATTSLQCHTFKLESLN